MQQSIDRSQYCFIVLPGLAPDPLSVVPIKTYLEGLGYAAIVTNFCGNDTTRDFSTLSIDDCLNNIGELIANAKKEHPIVVGIGISLGGALFIEHAKTHSDLNAIASIGTPLKLRKARLIAAGTTLSPVLHPIWKLFDKRQRARPLPVEALPMAMRFFEGRFRENLDAIQAPILFMHSKKDPATDYKALLEYVPRITNAHTQVMLSENGNHQMGYDPATIVHKVLAFLHT